jgi:tyrosyl-tRNA synthetase
VTRDVVPELEARGLVFDVSDRDALSEALASGPVTFYCGYDPTGVSLHAGSLVPLSLMRHLTLGGHRPIGLVGGATGMVGDPSGKSEERNLLDEATLEKNTEAVKGQLERLLGKSVTMVNNADWTRPVSVLDFLRDVGKHMTVNYMLSKDSVKSRIENREQGISYTEFSYMLLQAFDFVHLAAAFDCRLQVGGSDQWGNITCGIELQRKMGREPVFGLVGPLLTTASGGKFGKTAAGTSVWLDRDMTSPYRFYQYWINAEDADVERYLKMFTLVPLGEVAAIVAEHADDPGRRNAQRRLAHELTTWVHGEDSARAAEAVSEILFGGAITKDTPAEALELLAVETPTSDVPKTAVEEGWPVVDALVETGLSKSKGAARRLLGQGGVYVNNVRSDDPERQLVIDDVAAGAIIVLRSGKKTYHLVRLV